MVQTNVIKNNMVAGELDPAVAQREDLKVFKSGAEYLQNFFVTEQGPIRKRPGFRYVHTTRRGNNGWLVPFQFNDSDAYVLEMTDQYIRFYRNEGIIVEDAVTITGATQANPCVITTSGAHGYTTGDEVIISGVSGMTELNGKSYVVTVLTGTTFSIKDYTNTTTIDATGFTAYTSGGVAEKIYELITPYEGDYVKELQFAQNADTLEFTHRRYEQRKLTRTGHTNWTLSRYSRTADPFGAAQDIAGITQANPAVVTYSGADSFSNGDQVYIDSVAGMTEVNNTHFLIANVSTAANTFELQDLSGTDIDSSAYGAYSSAGKVELINNDKHPRSVFYTDDGRKGFGGAAATPDAFRLSRGPQNDGTLRYDDFTTGTDADHAVVFTLSPVQGQADIIQWMSNNDKFIVIGTFSTVRRVYGATEAEPLSPTSVTAKFVDSEGVALANPVPKGGTIFYIPRGKKSVNSFEYDFVVDGYITTDRSLVAGHLFDEIVQQIIFQSASPDCLWAVKNDGTLAGLTFKAKEDISGWHRLKLKDTLAGQSNIISLGIMPRTDNKEQLWALTERVINGNTVHSVEFMEDFVDYPSPLEFYTGNESTDVTRYRDYKYEKSKDEFFVDMGATYDGRVVGSSASASITPSATTGVITVTASGNVFTASMVGREIWKPYTKLGGGGRARIDTYNSATSVDCTVLVDFDNTNAMSAGSWYLTSDSLSGLHHLEGETVDICADGAEHPQKTVTDGAVALDYQASHIHVGLAYTSIWKSMELQSGGLNGTAMNKVRQVTSLYLRVLNSSPPKVGIGPYDLEQLTTREMKDLINRTPPLLTGVIEKRKLKDHFTREKNLYIVHDKPQPCHITSIDPFLETSNEQ